MPGLVVLYEHAAGYALFRVKEYEEVASFIPQVEKATLDLVKFKGLVQLIAFSPFKSGVNALENTNNVSEGILHEDLALFLETNVPKSKKKDKVILGISDPKIGSAIQDNLSFTCQHTGVVPEVLRGIRLHSAHLVDGLTSSSVSSAELSLGRSYSRAKVKFNVNRVDNMIIQSIALIDQLDKDINTFAMRLREWYGYHFPEMVKIVNDNYTYARVAKFIGNRKEAPEEEELLEGLEKILVDSGKAEAVVSAMKSSMGMDISPIDLINIQTFTSKVINLAEYRKQLMGYLQAKMGGIAPNLATLVGDIVGARLISHAGSLTNLAKYPASTVQILGAEKALFRALKTKGNTPKYGLIFHSTFIGRAESKNKGRISRFLANKCSIASRIDCFSEVSSDIFGQKLKEQVEERLKFYSTGQVPKKNIDVMHEAAEEVKLITPNDEENVAASEKKKKKKKKRKAEEESALEEVVNGADENVVEANGDAEEEPPKKKKKKKKSKAGADE
ncbi:Nucleolar protein 56 [Halotydeus destructor]|nr:Nucleolar protein 56 [Halotydeus destructor]